MSALHMNLMLIGISKTQALVRPVHFSGHLLFVYRHTQSSMH